MLLIISKIVKNSIYKSSLVIYSAITSELLSLNLFDIDILSL
ncbi:hypothetical protein M918_18985 [Clostridium sp. BL8]|nr:hypothetical protein M918_18985 [Clostridium sp. BL8]